ncbi:hypothetical protein GWI33_016641 [Rhynchophorus ferrugineus]|uniref:Uncharacterized protein n=1 Tax=Rhynchophorus ferrugineus TaxID=354439 RepID=A0A834HX05_RHYFE|nr:hypothetical protein GWI33_016641 [Rhynchophorus ferrugineus]
MERETTRWWESETDREREKKRACYCCETVIRSSDVAGMCVAKTGPISRIAYSREMEKLRLYCLLRYVEGVYFERLLMKQFIARYGTVKKRKRKRRSEAGCDWVLWNFTWPEDAFGSTVETSSQSVLERLLWAPRVH